MLLMKYSNPVLQSLLMKAGALIPTGLVFARAQPILLVLPNTKSNTATRLIGKVS